MTEMLQKTENVANNVANENSQDLTEQYKHGNLPDDRLYYYRFKGEPEVQITTQYGLYCEEADNKKEIEVIDFVPSYEELQNMNKAVNECMAANIKLVEKNTQLKELLKDCQEKILQMDYDSIKIEILQKINEVLK